MLQSYVRWQKESLQRLLRQRRVILLEGPRQCGKTTFAKSLAGSKSVFFTLDDEALLNSAIDDPKGFVAHDDNLLIIDEIQRAPALLLAIKKNVDENTKPGRFLLTGSADVMARPGVNESLAGRISKLRLRSCAQGELLQRKPVFLDNVFSGKIFERKKNSRLQKKDYLNLALSGGFFEPLSLNKFKDKTRWYKEYAAALIERDLKDFANIRRVDAIKKLLQGIAAFSAKFVTISDLSRSLGVSRQAVDSYLNLLEVFYLIERLPAWSKSDYERINKQDKIFVADTGLMSAVLNWDIDKVLMDGEKNGKLIESFVFHELKAIIDASETEYEIYHYRDSEKREIDFIIEDEKGAVVLIEVKSGSAINSASFKHIKWFAEKFLANKNFKGIILYSGEHPVSFGKNLWALPLDYLWQ